MTEAVSMNEALRRHADANLGFAQYLRQYELANADRETRAQYDLWLVDIYFDELEKRKIADDAHTEGKAEGVVEGIVIGADAMEAAVRMLKDNRDIGEIRAATGLPEERIHSVKAILGG
jgi:predicted transposase YdaD